MTEDFKEKAAEAVARGKKIIYTFHAMTEEVEKKLDFLINRIVGLYGKSGDMQTFLYTTVKELAINGLKANYKRIFFRENNLDILSEDAYNHGMTLYKEHMNEEMAAVYGQKAQNYRIAVSIHLNHSAEGVMVEVINHSSITPFEEKRFREKLQEVMAYDDLMQFYMDHADDTEGAGMGLALIVTLMKKVGINPHLFRMIVGEDKTTARIEVPFSKTYFPVRDVETVHFEN
jgi:hypothetical protein